MIGRFMWKQIKKVLQIQELNKVLFSFTLTVKPLSSGLFIDKIIIKQGTKA